MSAAVLFRAGRSAEAIERTREGIAMGGGEPSFDEAVFVAMSYATVGDHARARALLSRLGDGAPEGPSSEDWWNAQAHRLLRREATRLILDRDFPANPFAP